MTNKPLLVLGTHNCKKGLELADLLAPLGFDVQTLADFPGVQEVVEDGETFADNAAKKAIQQARHLGCWVLGEDSGLMVDALDGAPGVYSARYAGPDADDQANNAFLLQELKDAPQKRRGAKYVCHAVVSDPQGRVRARSEACCRGRILTQPRGTSGFGYDPLFEIPEYHRTFAELGSVVKACLSHRARAMRSLVPGLLALLDQGGWRRVASDEGGA